MMKINEMNFKTGKIQKYSKKTLENHALTQFHSFPLYVNRKYAQSSQNSQSIFFSNSPKTLTKYTPKLYYEPH